MSRSWCWFIFSGCILAISAFPVSATQPLPLRKDTFGDPLPLHALARIGSIRLRHSQPVTGLTFSPDGKHLASADQTGGIRLWDPSTGALTVVLAAEGERPAVLTFSPDGRVLTANDQNGSLTLYDIPSGKVRHRLQDVEQPPLLARFSPDSKLLASAAWGQNPVLWDVDTGKRLRLLTIEQPPLLALGFSGNGATVLGIDNRGAIHRWQTKDGSWLGSTPTSSLKEAAFSPDGQLLACGHNDGTLCLRDTVSGKELRRWVGKSPVRTLAFSADGNSLQSEGGFEEARWWDVATGQQKPVPGRPASGVLAVSADGKSLATTHHIFIRIWDAATSKERFTHLVGSAGAVLPLALSPDGKTVATQGMEKLGTQLWDTNTGRPRLMLADQDADTYCVAFQPNGRLLATGGEDRRVYLWDGVTGKKQATLPDHGGPVQKLAFAPDGATLVAIVWDTLHWWDSATGKRLRTVKAPAPKYFATAQFTPDGRTLAVVQNGANKQGQFQAEVLFLDTATGQPRKLYQTQGGDAALAFSPDGRLLALSVQPGIIVNGKIDVVEVSSGLRLYQTIVKIFPIPFRGLRPAAFSPDGRTLCYGSPDGLVLANGLTGAGYADQLPKRKKWITWLQMSTNGRTLATHANDLTILLWDVSQLLSTVKPTRSPLSKDKAIDCWQGMADKDASHAWRCVDRLCADPNQAVALLQELLQPVPIVERATLVRWVAELEDARFAVRAKATAALELVGDMSVPLLRERLAAKPPLETRRRVETLLAKIDPIQAPKVFRLSRAVAVLEYTRTPAARQLLEALAKGAPQALLTREAQASLQRLKGQL